MSEKQGERKMTQENIQTKYIAEKFQSAEQLWFWFLYSKSMQNGFSYRAANSTKRPCEILDVETMITKLFLAGLLNENQLETMKKFGDKRRAPHQHIWTENKDAARWKSAMMVIHNNAKKRGWIE